MPFSAKSIFSGALGIAGDEVSKSVNRRPEVILLRKVLPWSIFTAQHLLNASTLLMFAIYELKTTTHHFFPIVHTAIRALIMLVVFATAGYFIFTKKKHWDIWMSRTHALGFTGMNALVGALLSYDPMLPEIQEGESKNKIGPHAKRMFYAAEVFVAVYVIGSLLVLLFTYKARTKLPGHVKPFPKAPTDDCAGTYAPKPMSATYQDSSYLSSTNSSSHTVVSDP
ncbi:hypothetical protein EC988_001286, partial [Linderina pennispora]